jgi:hypothetical protein
MVTVKQEHRILETAPPDLRAAIILLSQAGEPSGPRKQANPLGQRREESRLI